MFGRLNFHLCSKECYFWQHPSVQNTFVCKRSRKVHFCGKKCDQGILSFNREGYICALTGIELDSKVEVHYVTLSKSQYSTQKYVGNNFISMDKKIPKGYKKPSTNLTKQISLAVVLILAGDDRYVQHSEYMSKFNKHIMSAQSPTDSFSFLNLQPKIREAIEKYMPYLKPPLSKTDSKLDYISNKIISYFSKFTDLNIKSPKVVLTFTAVCISKLVTGVYIKNITVIPKIQWIADHAPADIQYSGIKGLQCRNISIMWRRMLQEILCPHTGMPRHEKLFVC